MTEGGGPGTSEYERLDKFGRLKMQTWYRDKTDHLAVMDQFSYGYDRDSNRRYRKNEHGSGGDFSELYHVNDAATNEEYDGLSRLRHFRRGTLSETSRPNDTISANVSRVQEFTLDEVGNWSNFKDDQGPGGDDPVDWDLYQDRAHNDANETGVIAVWANPEHDAKGNMTTIPKPSALNNSYACTYDAWNRLVKVVDGANVVAEYRYDGLNRRIRKMKPAGGDDWNVEEYYYNSSWQLLEVRAGTATRSAASPLPEPAEVTGLYEQYVWSARYIDAPVLRDRDSSGTPGELNERLYYCNDANMNVTALLEYDSGNSRWDVVERYVYDPYGRPTIYNDDWSDTVDWADSKKNHIRYCGYYYDDETGLYHVRNRMYHAELGRWMQRDPSGYVDGMSLYAYGWCNPAAGRDASGLTWSQTECENWFRSSGTPGWWASHFPLNEAMGLDNLSVIAMKDRLAQQALKDAKTLKANAASGEGARLAQEIVDAAKKMLKRAEEPYLFWIFMREHGCKCCYLRRDTDGAVQDVDWKQGLNELKWIAKIGHKLVKQLPRLLTGLKATIPNPDLTGALGNYNVALAGIRDFLPDMYRQRAIYYGSFYPKQCKPLKQGNSWKQIVDRRGSPKK